MLPIPSSCGNSSHVDHTWTTIFLHLTILLEAPCAWFGVYCIFKLTPKPLLQAKCLLFAHQVWITYYSVVMCVWLTPVAFFPYIAFYSQGLFEYFEVDMVVAVYLMGSGFGGMLSSILCLFAYRHHSVLPETHPLKCTPTHFTALCAAIHTGTVLFMIPFAVSLPDQQTSLHSLQTAFSAPPCDLWHPRIFVFWFGVWEVMTGYIVFLAACSCLMVFFVVHSFHIIRIYQRITSKSTRKRQVGFLYALTLMASIPNLFLFFPTVAFVLSSSDSSSSYHAGLGDTFVCFVGLHGLVATVTRILSHKPYRKHAMGLMRRQPKRTVHCEVTTKTAKF